MLNEENPTAKKRKGINAAAVKAKDALCLRDFKAAYGAESNIYKVILIYKEIVESAMQSEHAFIKETEANAHAWLTEATKIQLKMNPTIKIFSEHVLNTRRLLL
jgi:hypothetical protein